MTYERIFIAPYCFQRESATPAFMLKHLLKNELKDKSRWKNDTSFYAYVQSAKSVIVQVAFKSNGRKLLVEIKENMVKFFNVPEVSTVWEETLVIF